MNSERPNKRLKWKTMTMRRTESILLLSSKAKVRKTMNPKTTMRKEDMFLSSLTDPIDHLLSKYTAINC